MKKHFFLALLSVATLAACNNPGTTSVTPPQPSSVPAAAGKPPFQFIPYTDASPTPGPDVRVIDVEAQNFAFVPDTIRLKQGEKVALKVTSTSGNHSFLASGLNVNVKVDEGQTVYIDLPTDKTGIFDFHCAVPCGTGHLDMKGNIVIE